MQGKFKPEKWFSDERELVPDDEDRITDLKIIQTDYQNNE